MSMTANISEQAQERTQESLPPPDGEGIDLLKLVAVFVSQWKTGVLCAAIVFVICVVILFLWKPVYEANSSLLPHEGAMQASSLLAMFSTKSPEDSYLGLLESRTVADQVVDQAHLMTEYHTTSRAAARGMLSSASKFTIGKDTLVKIRVRDPNAEQAAAIANAYLDALQNRQQEMTAYQAKMRRVVFEKQMDEEKDALSEAEVALKQEQQKSGLVQINAQTEMGLSAIASVRAQITSLQAQLAGLSASYTSDSVLVKRVQSQIAGLEAQERKLASGTNGVIGAALPTGKMPEANLEYLRKLRDVKYHEALLTALANQYESAHLAETNSVTEFQIVDRAVAPENKAWPPRRLFLALAAVFAAMCGCAAIVLKLLMRRIYADPVQREYLHEIRDSFRPSRG